MNFFGVGGFELVVIVGLAFFLLGPKKMIETSRDAGKIIRELKAERDKFTRMVMEEYEEEDEPERSPQSGTADPRRPSPDGAVSRPRGRIQPDSVEDPGPGDENGDGPDGEDSRPGSGSGAGGPA